MQPDNFQTALFETRHHYARFLSRTAEASGWVSQFREIVLEVRATLNDLRAIEAHEELAPDSYETSQRLSADLKGRGSDGLVYPSNRDPGGQCAALFFPDCASGASQGRHLDYHWNVQTIDFYRDVSSGQVFQIVE